ncbi:uncharacterized protein BDV17DRAFT_286893 [Aspergillus undulatus]|uniref:uncharacterized protein n=1 Tax=Aspergillus undulatus TaxID=1810928 RepID=UPI003CCD6493
MTRQSVANSSHLPIPEGLLVVTLFRAGFLGSSRFGSGVFIARSDGGELPPPSAVVISGGGFGRTFWLDVTDFVSLLHDTTAVNVLSRAVGITLGCNFTLASRTIRSTY